jgi:hypothetical protein
MRVLLAILASAILVMGSSEAAARGPASGNGGSGAAKTVTKTVPSTFSAAKIVVAQTQRLIKGIMAIRGKEKHVNKVYAARLVKEAREVIAEKGNSWMKLHILLGVAVMETDLRWWLKRGYGVQADCGLTQINLTSVRMSRYKKRRLCQMLRGKRKAPGGVTATKLSMRWSMKEMRTIKAKYCQGKWLARMKRNHKWTKLRKLTSKQHFWRCMLLVYNQGPRVITYKHNTCTFKRRYREDPSQAYLDKLAKKCRNRNRYFFRTWCFATGIDLAKPPRYAKRKWTRKGWKITGYRRASCRHAYSIGWVNKRYK